MLTLPAATSSRTPGLERGRGALGDKAFIVSRKLEQASLWRVWTAR
jgi:hypothetical protein